MVQSSSLDVWLWRNSSIKLVNQHKWHNKSHFWLIVDFSWCTSAIHLKLREHTPLVSIYTFAKLHTVALVGCGVINRGSSFPLLLVKLRNSFSIFIPQFLVRESEFSSSVLGAAVSHTTSTGPKISARLVEYWLTNNSPTTTLPTTTPTPTTFATTHLHPSISTQLHTCFDWFLKHCKALCAQLAPTDCLHLNTDSHP